ncbi:MAG: periplasmic heavy metal sensor [Candidatus Eisenbacteria bacterium]|nr:periplasmic heavy metal sensor [Candidatus Eisenbacteria bacterium]
MSRKTLTVILAVVAVIALSMFSTFAYERWMSSERKRAPRQSGHPFGLLRGELALTKEQMSQLETQRESFENELRGQRTQMREKRMALMEALRADAPDTQAIDGLVEEIGALQVGLEKQMIRHMLEEQRILTPEQREKLHSILRRHFSERENLPWMGPGGPMDEMGPGRGDGPWRGSGRGSRTGPGRGDGSGPESGMGRGRFPPPDSAGGMGPGPR